MGYLIAACVLAALIIIILLPVRLKVKVALNGAFAQGHVRAGLCWGALGVKLYFTVYKNAAGKPEARVRVGKRREKIFNPAIIMDALKEAKEARKADGKKRKKKGAGRFIRAILKKTRLRGVSIRGRVGSGDAAATALTIGAISSVAYSLFTPFAKAPPTVEISPNFNEAEIRLELAGIVDVYIGKSTLVELIRKRFSRFPK